VSVWAVAGDICVLGIFAGAGVFSKGLGMPAKSRPRGRPFFGLREVDECRVALRVSRRRYEWMAMICVHQAWRSE